MRQQINEEEKAEQIVVRLNALARKFYMAQGCNVPEGHDFSRAKHPAEQSCFYLAEIAYEFFMGDTPDYSDEEGDDD